MNTVKIDGCKVRVEQGATVLQAAGKLGIPIPTLCSLEDSEPFTACMLCVVEDASSGRLLPACSAPAEDGREVLTDSGAVLAARRAVLELLLAEHVGDCEAPCTLACPLQIDVAETIRRIEAGDGLAALGAIREATAFPGLVCSLCPAPCERTCRRGKYDQAVSIAELLAYASAAGRGTQTLPAIRRSTGKSVAVIGAGPAGLSAAYHLARLGHGCTIFEARAEAGGTLRSSAPEAADQEIAILRQMGVELITNQSLDDARALQRTRDSHDALIVAAGPDINPLLEEAGLAAAAAGSLLKPDCSFVQALAQGKAAAVDAHRHLEGQSMTGPPRRFHSHIGRLLPGEIQAFLEGAAVVPRIEADPGGYTPEQTAVEARRCLRCDCTAKEDCLLRIHAESCEVRRRHFRVSGRRRYRRIRQHPEVDFEPGKCIKCGICVRLSERSSTPENTELGLAFLKRGYDLEVGTPFGESLSRALAHSAERCVASCPTGALSFRRRPRMEV